MNDSFSKRIAIVLDGEKRIRDIYDPFVQEVFIRVAFDGTRKKGKGQDISDSKFDGFIKGQCNRF